MNFFYESPYKTGGSFMIQNVAAGTIIVLLSIKFCSARGLR